MSSSPNVVVCTCDQLRSFAVGCYGNEVVRTPNIDRLAGEGVRFVHAVTNDPVCMPARSCLLSGQYSRTCMGSLSNATELDDKGAPICAAYPVDYRPHLPDETLPESFRKLGYDTALFGKWHVHPAPNLVGFDYSLYPRVNHRHTGQAFVENGGPERVVDGFSVDFEIESVEKYLATRCGKPFFMFYNISPPHMPLADAPDRYLNMYSPDEVHLRPNVFVDGQPAYDEEWFKIYLWDFLYYSAKLPHTMALPDGFDIRQLTAMYYGLVTWVDDTVGRLTEALESNGMADNTILLFVADHGDNLGSHHRFNKSMLIEEAIRIPMLFHAPSMWAPSVCTEQVSQLIDVMPTLLAACGAPVPPHVQGRNLVPVLTGQRAVLDESWAFVETDPGQIGIRTPTHLYGMRLAGDFRTVQDPEELFFDLPADPYEQNNLAGATAQRELAEWLRSLLEKWNRTTPWMGGTYIA